MTWQTGTNPGNNETLDQSGRLRFANAAEQVGMGKAAERYTVAWSRFDNASSTHIPVGEPANITTTSAQAPRALLDAPFVAATIRGHDPDHPEWAQPLVAFFRRAPDGTWSLVGLERGADETASGR
jgi:hypothetical protein